MKDQTFSLDQLLNRGAEALRDFSQPGINGLFEALHHLGVGMGGGSADLVPLRVKVGATSRSQQVALLSGMDNYYARSARGVQIDDPNLR